MQEEFETRIRENMADLVDLTSNVEEIAKILRGKNILSEEEEEEIISAESSFDKKSKLFWLMSKKDASTCDDLLDALKATGNKYVAEKFSAASNAENGVNHVEAEVTVETSKVTPDAEGMALAVEIEKEFERMQTEDDARIENVEDSSEEQTHKEQEVTGNHVEEDEDDNESDVRVEITAPTESEPEPSETEQEKEQETANNDHDHDHEPVVVGTHEHSSPAMNNEEHEQKEEVVDQNGHNHNGVDAHEKETEDEPMSSSTPKKQVTFGEASQPEPKEFVLNEEPRADSTSSNDSKSIVAMNRERFEQGGTPGAVKYSFKKGGGTSPVAKEDEPKESTVKNLRNFFQKLGSVEPEEGVQKRPGIRSGGTQNRRTMI